MRNENPNLEQNEVPFKELEYFSEDKYSIEELSKKYPDVIIKEMRTEWKEPASPGIHPLNDHERIIEDTGAVVNNFGEYVPKTQLVKGKNKQGEVIIYVLQERVRGKRLDELEYSEETARQLRIFLDKVIDNYIKHLFQAPGENEPRSFYPDLNFRNFFLGTTKSGPAVKLHFVDTYPIGGGTPSFVISKVIPNLISRWPSQWKVLMEEFAVNAERKIFNFVSKNKDSIPKQSPGSLYRK